MNNAEKQELIDRYLAAYNAFDIDGMVALLSPDVRFENYTGGELTASTTGVEAFRQLAEQSKVLFSEREQHITKVTFREESVVAEIAYCGCLAVNIPDGPAAGTVLNLKGQSEFAFQGGKISQIIDRS
ncbi:nuclear transport factor 2 family protein [Oscillatoria acuminata]|uniref:Ketosteroid isomerase-like protein n=1 Tax=Oscillatoria acuminata PCC 6304 TaxID=56110 RepID=K9TL26_9CYAN|nr:nuclear transport factor 2 family protein [Oscillatoria acuminata]AFY82826.1 ketosteroid isomerase-like protein [Oscillatoria acuminata PCC 6304]